MSVEQEMEHQQWLYFPLHVTMEAGWQDFFFPAKFLTFFFSSVETLKGNFSLQILTKKSETTSTKQQTLQGRGKVI